MKILWISDSPEAPTGYGNVTRFVCGGLADAGHEVVILGSEIRTRTSDGRDGKTGPHDTAGVVDLRLGEPRAVHGCLLYPAPQREELRGADGAIKVLPDNRRELLLELIRSTKPDLFITLTEIGWLSRLPPQALGKFREMAGVPWVFYYAVDGDMGDSRLPESWLNVLAAVDLPVAMSSYGLRIAEANGIQCRLIPHGVDTSLFSPPADKATAKRRFGWEGKFVILSDARNHIRKQLPRTLEIFRRFAADKKDVVLALHCDPDDPSARTRQYCYDLRSDIESLELGDQIALTAGMSITGGGISLEHLAEIYQAADIHLLASFGEGFGLPTLQAAAAGLAPMAGDYTTGPELVHGHGETIRIDRLRRDELGICHALIDIDDAVEKLNVLYRDRERLSRCSHAARRFAESYDWKKIIPQWEALGDRALSTGTGRLIRGSAHAMPREDQSEVMVSGTPLTIPTGACIYAAGAADLPVFRRLQKIFPCLTASTSSPQSAEYRRCLASCAMALDLDKTDPELSVAASELGIPYLSKCEVEAAVRIGRSILADLNSTS